MHMFGHLSLLIALCGCEPNHDSADSYESGVLELVETSNPLAVYAQWTTDEPTTSHLEVLLNGEEIAVLSEDLELLDELKTEHSVLVAGLPSDSELQFVVHAQIDGEVIFDAETELVTPALPEFLNKVEIELSILDTERADSTWTLVCINAMNGGHKDEEYRMPVVLDREGRVRWYYELPLSENTNGYLTVSKVDGGVLLGGAGLAEGEATQVIDWAWDTVWTGPTQGSMLTGYMHHTSGMLGNEFYTVNMTNIDYVVDDQIIVMDESGEQTWSWSPQDHIDDAHQVVYAANMVEVTPEFAFWSTPHAHDGTYYKVSRETGEILWSLGSSSDFALTPGQDWFNVVHGIHWTDDGTLLMYDNRGGSEGNTRILEMEVDEDLMTADIIWEYPGETGEIWFDENWGGAQRLENGNTVFTRGCPTEDLEEVIDSRIVEVTPEGETVWEVLMLSDIGQVGAFRIERIAPALLSE